MNDDKYEGYPPFLKQYFEDHDILVEYNKQLDKQEEDKDEIIPNLY